MPPLRLDGRAAVIGRSPDADWSLPDPTSQVSSRHAQIAHRDGVYMLVDTSTNGTFVNGRRLAGPHRLASGDVIGIGDYQIGVLLEAAVAGMSAAPPAPGRIAQAMRPASPTAVSLAPGAPVSGGLAALLQGAGLDRSHVPGEESAILATAGGLLRRLLTSLRAMDEERRRARAQIGAAAVPPGSNPIAAARSPEQALALMLSPPQPGVMPAAQAIDEIGKALEAHRVAVLQAMQAALGQTLARISPEAIRGRAGKAGDPSLWQAYEKAFAEDGGFVEMFASAYQRAYEAQATPGG